MALCASTDRGQSFGGSTTSTLFDKTVAATAVKLRRRILKVITLPNRYRAICRAELSATGMPSLFLEGIGTPSRHILRLSIWKSAVGEGRSFLTAQWDTR